MEPGAHRGRNRRRNQGRQERDSAPGRGLRRTHAALRHFALRRIRRDAAALRRLADCRERGTLRYNSWCRVTHRDRWFQSRWRRHYRYPGDRRWREACGRCSSGLCGGWFMRPTRVHGRWDIRRFGDTACAFCLWCCGMECIAAVHDWKCCRRRSDGLVRHFRFPERTGKAEVER